MSDTNLFADLEDEAQLKREGIIGRQEAPDNVQGEQHDADAASRDTYGGHDRSRKQSPGAFKCSGCNGSGIIHVYHRGGGWGQRGTPKKCWKGCNGTGYLKTSPEERAANKRKRQEKKASVASSHIAEALEFLDANPNITAWLQAGIRAQSEFHHSLNSAIRKYGSWTDGQLRAARKSTAKWLWRKRAKARDSAAAVVEGLDISAIPSGTYAVPGGDTRLKIAIRRPGARSKWLGWIFVDDGAEYGSRQNYGRQRPGGVYEGKIVDQLKAILADPLEALAAYGQLTGSCGACGRLLEDEDSVARGIGPICYAKLSGG